MVIIHIIKISIHINIFYLFIIMITLLYRIWSSTVIVHVKVVSLLRFRNISKKAETIL